MQIKKFQKQKNELLEQTKCYIYRIYFWGKIAGGFKFKLPTKDQKCSFYISKQKFENTGSILVILFWALAKLQQ